ncbi:MAG: MFS transporter [Christensenellaceae bacterium]|jgi:Na+/melibiose symporter-like transporter|nr:MFS transporter [Christensenellaceae bacterium]
MKKIDARGKISFFSKICYGMGETTFGVTNTILSVYLLIMLTDYLKVSSLWATLIVAIGIVWDAITDPIVGYLSDNSGGRFGRRRRFILIYAIPLGISFIMLWMIPTILPVVTSEGLKILTILPLYLCVITFLTLINVPYGSVIMEMTDDYDERTGLTGFRMVSSAFATLGSIFIADTILGEGPIYQTGGNLIYVGIVFGILIIVTTLLCFWGTFERRQTLKPLTKPKFDFKKYVILSWKSKPFRQVAIAYLCAFTVIGLLQTLLQYYSTYWLRAPELFVVLAGMVLILAILSTPAWVQISKKLGKRMAFLISCGLSVASLIGIFFIPQLETADFFADMIKTMAVMPFYGYVFIFFLGIGIGGIQLIPFSMMPDAINFSMKSGDMDEGAYYGIVTFVQKLGMGVATMLIGPALALAHYQNPPTDWPSETLFQQAASANQAIRGLFVGLSIVVIAIGAISVIKYTVDRDALRKKMESPDLPGEGPDFEESNNEGNSTDMSTDTVTTADINKDTF